MQKLSKLVVVIIVSEFGWNEFAVYVMETNFL